MCFSRTPIQVADRLAKACSSPDHVFWPEDIGLLSNDVLNWGRILGHRQVTDAYLLAVATRHKGRFVTFDQRLSVDTVISAEAENLCVIS